MTSEECLLYLHGCCGTYALDGCTGFSRFTPDQLDFYSRRSDPDFVRCHAPAGIFLECVTDEPVISFTYRLYREKSQYIMNSGIDFLENGVFSAHFSVDPNESGNVTVSYVRRRTEPSVIRIVFPNGCVLLPLEFHLGNARPTPKKPHRILFYGDSITQSAYIPTPSLSWFLPVADALDAEYINRGIGSMIFDKDSLPAEDVCPYKIFIEYGINDLVKTSDNDTALEAADAWLNRLRTLYPTSEAFLILPDFFPEDGLSEAILCRLDSYCEGLTALCRPRRIAVLPGKPLIPSLPALYCADHVHFNEGGSAVFACCLLSVLRNISV